MVSSTTGGNSIIKQPTIVLTTTQPGGLHHHTAATAHRLFVPKLNIKIENPSAAPPPPGKITPHCEYN